MHKKKPYYFSYLCHWVNLLSRKKTPFQSLIKLLLYCFVARVVQHLDLDFTPSSGIDERLFRCLVFNSNTLTAGWPICGHAGNAPSAGVPPVATLLVFTQLWIILPRPARDAGHMPTRVNVLKYTLMWVVLLIFAYTKFLAMQQTLQSSGCVSLLLLLFYCNTVIQTLSNSCSFENK